MCLEYQAEENEPPEYDVQMNPSAFIEACVKEEGWHGDRIVQDFPAYNWTE